MEILKIPVCGCDQKPTRMAMMRELLFTQFETPPSQIELKFEGEASRNQSIISFIAMLKREEWNISPKICTYLPRGDSTSSFLSSAINILNEDYPNNNPEFVWWILSTSESQRKRRFGDVISLTELAKLVEKYPSYKAGKIILSFSMDHDIDVNKIRNFFDPKYFAIRLIEPEGLPLGIDEKKREFISCGYDVHSLNA